MPVKGCSESGKSARRLPPEVEQADMPVAVLPSAEAEKAAAAEAAAAEAAAATEAAEAKMAADKVAEQEAEKVVVAAKLAAMGFSDAALVALVIKTHGEHSL